MYYQKFRPFFSKSIAKSGFNPKIIKFYKKKWPFQPGLRRGLKKPFT
ncbi:hypothetical protein OMAG_002914 [Candidatus Omnitrophus magneticus]|uniref:Uncharacterized protein n=1 Tax=Candidatus Omnitrophus magneticus TaxID=1609969 RepID=A0A0F0CP97_9BACT|nr:hypothetical protein OMAG_002914 [Candidatus Omnitrophus magneticus]